MASDSWEDGPGRKVHQKGCFPQGKVQRSRLTAKIIELRENLEKNEENNEDVTSCDRSSDTLSDDEKRQQNDSKYSTPSKKKSIKSQTIFDLWKVPKLLKLSLILYFSWFAQAFIYYGSVFNIGNLGGSVFINYTIFGFAYGISNTFLLLMMGRYGRRKLLIILFTGEAVAFAGMFMTSFSESVLAYRISFAFFSNFCVAGAYNIVYLYTAECFPTTMRQVGIGSCSVAARVGSVLAPFVKELTNYTHLSVSFMTFGGLALVNLFLIMWVPETKDREIPDTIDQADQGSEEKLVKK